MGTAILRSHDCLKTPSSSETLRSPPSLSKSLRNSTGNNPIRFGRRKRTSLVGSSETLPSPSTSETVRNFTGNNNPVRLGRRSRANMVGSSGKENGDCESRCRTVVKIPAKNLVMGQVTILKRGEELKSIVDRRSDDESQAKVAIDKRSEEGKEEKKAAIHDEDSVFCSTDRLGPEPELVTKEIRFTDLKSVKTGGYAGSGFFSSPSPRSVPLPAFFSKKDVSIKNDVATMDLHRLLGLDLL
eukprot:TRINITY_DN17896_c0_g1_i1.p1 TRINITY_DN17896_c0_g1~~TRINITY_DN17896_c0_g1_i1.p1  ORF type:complete len:242 (-),score=12.73 TRINITY_DN17896_c0_g1_i1:317-1042(-)